MEKILITGGKGGVGKTSVTASVGIALALSGEKTVLVDGDIGLNNLDVALHAEERILYDIGDVATGKATISQALLRIEKNLFLLPSFTACSSAVSAESFEEIISELNGGFRFVLIDCPAGVERSFLRSARCARSGIIVTTPHISGVRDAYKTSKILAGLGYAEQKLVVNRIKSNLVDKGKSLSAEQIAEAVRLPLLGVVPESAEIDLNGIPDFSDPRDGAAYSYRLIADCLSGKEKRIYDYIKDGKKLGSRLRRLRDSI
ncbi:MAG: P-loop NTPase [Christensenellales bacterium]